MPAAMLPTVIEGRNDMCIVYLTKSKPPNCYWCNKGVIILLKLIKLTGKQTKYKKKNFRIVEFKYKKDRFHSSAIFRILFQWSYHFLYHLKIILIITKILMTLQLFHALYFQVRKQLSHDIATLNFLEKNNYLRFLVNKKAY